MKMEGVEAGLMEADSSVVQKNSRTSFTVDGLADFVLEFVHVTLGYECTIGLQR